MVKNISIDELKPGMVIVRITAQNGPVKIRKSGLVTSPQMVLGLAEMGVQEVEIDPEQQVEIEAPVVEKSQTQKLLESDAYRQSGVDHALSEQFNRSLFLPSVQELPNKWQFYGPRALVIALMIVGGFGIGWSAADYKRWIGVFTSSSQHVTAAPADESNSQPSVQPTITQADSTTSPQSDVAASVADTSQQVDGEQNVATVAVNTPTQNDEVPVEAEPFLQPGEREVTSAYSQPQQVITEAQANVNISPDLMRRFERAISELDDAPEPEYKTDVVSVSDMPKIHELPAKTLTRLPSMAFSAHMYASDQRERWVRVNGRRAGEGDYIDTDLRIERIEPQQVVLSFRGELFSMAALTDW